MRTKIIAGNLITVLVLGLVSYFLVSGQIENAFVAEVDERVATDQELLTQTWRLSGHELARHAQGFASEAATHDVFLSASTENLQRDRAFRRANEIMDQFARIYAEGGGPPELVVITNDRGVVIARNQDRNRMHNDDLTQQLSTLSRALSSGTPAIDVWSFAAGQRKLLLTAIVPIHDQSGVMGALIVAYDMSNGMASRLGHPLSREIAFFDGERVYSSSLGGERLAEVQTVLFEQQTAATQAALSQDANSEAFRAELGDAEYVGAIGPLPSSASTPVGYAIFANRTAQAAKAAPTLSILVAMVLGLIVIIIYGFLIGSGFLKPVEEMEEGILQVINGRTDMRLDIKSQEFGGLAYRINQLLNVFTGTEEADADGRVSSPPEAWGAVASEAGAREPAPSGASAAAAPEGTDAEEAAVARELAAEPEDAYYARLFAEYVAAKEAVGENVSNITEDKFVKRLRANEQSLIKKHACRMVRFQVQTKGTQVNLRPVIIH